MLALMAFLGPTVVLGASQTLTDNEFSEPSVVMAARGGHHGGHHGGNWGGHHGGNRNWFNSGYRCIKTCYITNHGRRFCNVQCYY